MCNQTGLDKQVFHPMVFNFIQLVGGSRVDLLYVREYVCFGFVQPSFPSREAYTCTMHVRILYREKNRIPVSLFPVFSIRALLSRFFFLFFPSFSQTLVYRVIFVGTNESSKIYSTLVFSLIFLNFFGN